MNEAQALQWLDGWARAGKPFSGPPSWRRAKAAALCAIERELGPLRILDVGVGDMRHLVEWGELVQAEYLGIDGSLAVVQQRQREHPILDFACIPFSRLVESSGLPMTPNVILLWDVLYHIPDDALHDALIRWVFEQPADVVAVSWAQPTAPPTNPAALWFPRPWPGPPPGWDGIFAAEELSLPHHQRMEVYRRAT